MLVRLTILQKVSFEDVLCLCLCFANQRQCLFCTGILATLLGLPLFLSPARTWSLTEPSSAGHLAKRKALWSAHCEKKTKHTLIILILLCQAFAGGKIIILAGAQHKHCPLKVTGVFQESLISSFSSVNMFLPLQSHLCGQLVKTNSLGNVWHRGWYLICV